MTMRRHSRTDAPRWGSRGPVSWFKSLVPLGLFLACGGRSLSAEDFDAPLPGFGGGGRSSTGAGGFVLSSGGRAVAGSGGALTRGDCCEAHDTPGCDEGQVVRCVCQASPSCCQFAWDDTCVRQVDALGCGSCTAECDGELTAAVPMTIYGTTTGMRDDYAVSCAPAGAPDVVLGFTAPATATYFFDTAGSDFDTVLSLRTGGCEGSELTCNDDARDLTSAITTYLLAGQRVGIVVDGYSGANGSFTLDVRSDRESPILTGGTGGGRTGGSPTGGSPDGGTGGAVPLDSCCRISDDPGCADPDVERCVCSVQPRCCEFAWDESCVTSVEALGCGRCDMLCDAALEGPLPLTVAGTTVGAGNDHAGTCGGDEAADVAYRFTAPQSGRYSLSLEGSAYDTLLYVVDGGCAGMSLACNDDQVDLTSGLSLWLNEGQTVGIVVDGFSWNQGSYRLTVDVAEGGAGGEPGWGGAAGEGGDDQAGGAAGTAALRSSSCCWPGSAPACDDPGITDCVCDTLPSCCTDSWSTVCVAEVTRLGCGECEPCAPALGQQLPVTVIGTTTGSPNAHASSCGSQGAPDVTFAFTAPEDGDYAFDTVGSAYDTVLELLDSPCAGSPLGCNDDWSATTSRITVWMSRGQTVGVVVDGWSQHAGDFVLTASRP